MTDAGLGQLKGLATFWWKLDLWRTRVIAAGLVHLKGLAHLKAGSLSETGVTDRGITDLEKAVANVRITR